MEETFVNSDGSKRTVKTPVIDKETAENEFDRFVECMDLDVNTADMDAEDLTAFNKHKNRIVRAVMQGSLMINGSGEAVYTPSHPKTKHSDSFTFHEHSFGSLMAMDRTKRGHDVGKTCAVMAEMCGVHKNVIAGLVGIDAKICMALFSLLMD